MFSSFFALTLCMMVLSYHIFPFIIYLFTYFFIIFWFIFIGSVNEYLKTIICFGIMLIFLQLFTA
ncbi:hypothetical protein D3Z47_15480 [Lachnospiraceae bacterium]|nr:hypothetical protein [Lachnospiraceae bacterium]